MGRGASAPHMPTDSSGWGGLWRVDRRGAGRLRGTVGRATGTGYGPWAGVRGCTGTPRMHGHTLQVTSRGGHAWLHMYTMLFLDIYAGYYQLIIRSLGRGTVTGPGYGHGAGVRSLGRGQASGPGYGHWAGVRSRGQGPATGPGSGHWAGVRSLGRVDVIDRISLHTWRVSMFGGALESLEKDPCSRGHWDGVRSLGRGPSTGPESGVRGLCHWAGFPRPFWSPMNPNGL